MNAAAAPTSPRKSKKEKEGEGKKTLSVSIIRPFQIRRQSSGAGSIEVNGSSTPLLAIPSCSARPRVAR
jgi:hypothetical protein